MVSATSGLQDKGKRLQCGPVARSWFRELAPALTSCVGESVNVSWEEVGARAARMAFPKSSGAVATCCRAFPF